MLAQMPNALLGFGGPGLMPMLADDVDGLEAVRLLGEHDVLGAVIDH